MRVLILCGLIAAVSSALAETLSHAAPPALRGDDAVAQLKERGEYESLRDAVAAARRASDQRDGTPDGVGQTAQVFAADGMAGDRFGGPVAVSGDIAVIGAIFDDVGANTDQGSAYVFVRSGSRWVQQQQLVATGGAATDLFGSSVAISGDTIIVGALSDDVGANANQGSAYVFVRSGGVWSQVQQLTASDGTSGVGFGVSAAMTADTAVIGVAAGSIGSAYVFTRSGGTWSQQQKLTASDGNNGNFFGYSVALSGETALIGAEGTFVGGAAYVFLRSGSIWTQQQKLTASDGQAGEQFGSAVALSGETALVGSDAAVGGVRTGAAYAFTRSGATWTQQQKLIASDGAVNDRFGASLALEGNMAVVGAYQDNSDNEVQGSIYVFARSGPTWMQQQQLKAGDGEGYDQFGAAVALSGMDIVVGAVMDDVAGTIDQGSAYFFRVLTGFWALESVRVAADGASNDSFGFSVAVSGETAIVGAPKDNVGANMAQGSAYIFVRSGGGWIQQQQLTDIQGAATDNFGESVAISGDRVLIGAPRAAVGSTPTAGRAFIFSRTGNVWSREATLISGFPGPATGDLYGHSVALFGETAVVGAYGSDVGGNQNQGRVTVHLKPPAPEPWAARAVLTASDGAASDSFGFSVAGSGNTIVVGAFADDVGANPDQGSVYVFVGSAHSWTLQQHLTAADGAAADSFGYSVALHGERILVGANRDAVGANMFQGSAYVFLRSGVTWSQQQKLTASDGATNDFFGTSVALSEETAVVGANLDDVNANLNQGSAYVFGRTGSVWTQQQRLIGPPGASDDDFGRSVALSGALIAVGAPQAEPPSSPASGKVPVPSSFSTSAAPDQGAFFLFIDAPPPPLQVTTLDDHDDGTCSTSDCTLREAIMAAANQPGDDVINFAPSVSGTIQLNSALPQLATNLNIVGPGAALLTVRRNGASDFRIFTTGNNTVNGPTISISGLTITNGRNADGGGGVLHNYGNLTISHCVIAGNTAPSFPATGGGILNREGILSVENCTVSGNTAFSGGAIANSRTSAGTGSTTVINSTLSDNIAAGGDGGAVLNGNTASGAVSAVTLINCTLTGNQSSGAFGGNGGAIYNTGVSSGSGTVALTHCTLNNNSASNGGGISNAGTGQITLRENILKSNGVSPNIVASGGGVASQGYNLSNDAAGGAAGTGPGGFLNATGDIRNTDPQLNPAGLANHGGPTMTIALLSGSPAIDPASNSFTPPFDQRGYGRVGTSDIGAFEFNGVPPPAPVPTGAVSRKLHNGTPFDVPLPLTGSSGVECRSGGAGNDYQVVVTFASAVTFTGASVTAGAGSVGSSSGGGSHHPDGESHRSDERTNDHGLYLERERWSKRRKRQRAARGPHWRHKRQSQRDRDRRGPDQIAIRPAGGRRQFP